MPASAAVGGPYATRNGTLDSNCIWTVCRLPRKTQTNDQGDGMSDEDVLRAQMEMLIDEQRKQSSKLDRLTDAMTRLATHEERLSSHYQGMQRLGARLDRFEDRVANVENKENEKPRGWGDNGVWVERLMVGALSGSVVAVLVFVLGKL